MTISVFFLLFSFSGEPFWCGLEIMPIMNENHEVVLFLITYHKFVRRETIVDPDSQVHTGNTSLLLSLTLTQTHNFFLFCI